MSYAPTSIASTLPAPAAIGRGALWSGRIVSTVLVLLLLLDAAGKLFVIQPVADGTLALGWPNDPATIRWLGIILIAATALYAVPRTSILGAILLTAYLGGAVATHARIGSPLPTHTLFGVYVGIAVWGGLWLRDATVRAMIPFRR